MDAPKPMKWWFHSDVHALHLLFESFELSSPARLLGGYLFTIAICWSERAITYYLDGASSRTRRNRWRTVLIRTLLYAMVTTLRLWYMLITMYFNVGLFLVVVMALTSAQLVTETLKCQESHRSEDGYTVPPSTSECSKCIHTVDSDEGHRLLSCHNGGEYELEQNISSSKS